MQSKIFLDRDILNILQSTNFIFQNFEKLTKLFRYRKSVSVFLSNSIEDLKRKTENNNIPNWIIGCNYDDKIFVLNPKDWQHRNKTSLEKLIVHEIVHVVINNSNNNCPIWLNEGLALWYADQVEELDLPGEKFSNPYVLDYSGEIYSCSAQIIKKLFDTHAESLLIKHLLSITDFIDDEIFGLCALEKLFYNKKEKYE